MTFLYPGTSLSDLYARYRGFDLLVDSRRLANPQRTLFFALPGARTNGHAYITDLYERGVRNFVLRRNGGEGLRKQVFTELRKTLASSDLNLIVTDDPLAFLQDLAAHHRAQFDIPVVGVTGSNGKTIVKDWLTILLAKRYQVCSSPRSFNSQIGVPLSVWQLRPDHEVAVFEAGVSQRGEMERLASIIQPTCGAFTMLGAAHAEGFQSLAEKHQQKMGLFANADWVVVPADDNASIGILRKMGVEVVPQLGFDHRMVEVAEVPVYLSFPPLNAVYLENAYTAIAVAYSLGITPEELAESVKDLQPLGNRLEQREGLHGGPVINDSYSNDFTALAAAIDFAVAQNPYQKLTLILGTLQPMYSPQALEQLLDGVVTRLITVGRNIKSSVASLHYANTEDLLQALPNLAFQAETVLVKGASYQGMDRVADALSRKQHRTVLQIDLAAMRHNFLLYRQSVKSGMIVMVKASAYGGGALPVARTLADAGADYLAVAYPDEGAGLRRGGLTLPIMVLNAEPHTFHRMREDALEPVVHSVADMRAALVAGLRMHLEVDTGMGRLGFPAKQLGELLGELESGQYERSICSVFTHLAASESPQHDAFTREQLTAFDEAYEKIAGLFPKAPQRHVLNTNGITRFPEYAYDYVRLGIGLYGIGDADQPGLRPVLQLTTRITAIYDRPAGTTVGYGRAGKLAQSSTIAVLAIGYADGLPRLAGNGAYAVMINGQPAPIVGAVCMDMTMVDLGKGSTAKVGDEVVVFGPEHPIEALAEAAQTIPYEVLTGIGERVHRVYTQE